ncbi:hypothetical protein [Bradyrhizobium liaoningense]
MRERARGEDEEGEPCDSVLSAYEAFALALAATVLKNYFSDYREAFGIDELGITESEAAGIVLAHAVFAIFPGDGNVRMTSAVLQTYFGADMDEWFEGVIDELVKELDADVDRSQLWPTESEMRAAKALDIGEIEQECEAGKWSAYADALNVLSGCYWSKKEALG